MPSIDRVLYVSLILMMTACTPTSNTMPDSGDITEISTVAVQPSMIPLTSEDSPTLEAGQWTYIFYNEELQQVTLVNRGPEQGKPVDEPLELWGGDGMQ